MAENLALVGKANQGQGGLLHPRRSVAWLWSLRTLLLALAIFLALLSFSALQNAPDQESSLHFLLRKPLFSSLAYGLFLPASLSLLPPRDLPQLRKSWLAIVSLLAGLLLVSSASRLLRGDWTWYAPVGGLTENHKTLAVSLAPLLPLLILVGKEGSPPLRVLSRLLLGLSGLALILALSKAALIAAVAGLVLSLPLFGLGRRGRILGTVGMIAAGVLLAGGIPLWTGSSGLIDSFDSRQSLNLKAWEMFRQHPWLGEGPGTFLTHDLHTFPHYRINGVEAHGVIQKMLAEGGLLGLLAWGLLTVVLALPLYRRADLTRVARGIPQDVDLFWAAWVALHINLLFSTEAFTCSHWVPLGMILGMAGREERRQESPVLPSSVPPLGRTWMGVSTCLLVPAVWTALHTPSSRLNEGPEVEAVVTSWLDALSRGDAQAADSLRSAHPTQWLPGEPAPHQDPEAASYQALLTAEGATALKLQMEERVVVVGGDGALLTTRLKTSLTASTGAPDVKEERAATILLAREQGEWRIAWLRWEEVASLPGSQQNQ